jgi:ribosomal protein S18 acetylase RimI-like enzyme
VWRYTMEQTKQKIKIVEYHEGLAAGVAEMWNLSRDGWGGDSHVTTEEKVRIQEANSSNLNLYLAMDEDKVVGYCGLSEYREDEGALYIPLLNARSDYHGRKIGKQLVLKALERAVELGWPRLDLYTWAGNTKAVPLYKKSGFFWEDRDDKTHLMNFMPTVLNTEAVREFFNGVDWYDSSTRVIEISPDGRKENEFTYYEYKWEKDGKTLRMEFERTGRGLRLIETDDYLISAEVENFQLVCDSTYTVRYFVKNKAGEPLNIELNGENHKIVSHSYQKSFDVTDEIEVVATFKLNEFEEEQSNWRTHPSVVANLLINGKKAKFAVGVLPKLPAKITGTHPGYQSYLHEQSNFYLDVENNIDSAATFTFNLPENELLSLEKSSYQVELQPKGKASIPVAFKLNKFGFYSPEISVDVLKESGEKLSFSKQIGIGFKGLGARFSGECDKYWHIYNGLYHMYFSKLDNDVVSGRLTKGTQKTIGLFPKVGKPYSSEFSKRRPTSIRYEEQNGSITLRATFHSVDFPGLELESVSTLFAEGLLEQSYIVRNQETVETENSIWINQPIYHELYKPVFVMNGMVTEVDEQANADYGLWDNKQITENWLVSRYSPYMHGLSWPKNSTINFESWYMYVEHNLGAIPPQSEMKTEPVYHSFGAYQTWEEFRDFANKERMLKSPVTKELSLVTKNLNEHEVEIELKDKKVSFFQGSVHMESDTNTIFHKQYSLQDESRGVTTSSTRSLYPLQRISVNYEINGIELTKETLVINLGKEPITIQHVKKEGHEVLEASNGCITIAASGSFFPALFSLKALGKEWLDSSFPTLTPKSWWNPWSGGVRSNLSGINHKSSSKEETIASEGRLVDQFGREWKGIKLSTTFKENETVKGLGIEQYFVMLPGIPFVAYSTKILQNTGTYFHYRKWYSECAFKPGSTIDQGWIRSNGEQERYIAGKSEFMTELGDHILVGSKEDDEKILQIIADREAIDIETYINKEVQSLAIWRELHLASGKEILSPPIFFVANQSILTKDEVEQLQEISFKEVLHENY